MVSLMKQCVRLLPGVEWSGDVELEVPVAGEGDLDDGGAGRVVDGRAVVQLGFRTMSQNWFMVRWQGWGVTDLLSRSSFSYSCFG